MRQSEFEKSSPPTESGQLDEWLRTDFTSESDSKERILEHLLIKIPYQKPEESKKRGFYMKKILIQKKAAQYYDYSQEETPDRTYAIPEELEGKLYDKDGNILEKLTESDRVYNKDGEEVIISAMIYQDENGNEVKKVEALTKAEIDAREDSQMTTLTDPEAAKPYLAFDFFLPSYLPKGYAFDRIQLFNDENAKPVKINEHEGVMNDRQLDVEIDGVMYMFFGKDAGIHGNELLKIAESL